MSDVYRENHMSLKNFSAKSQPVLDDPLTRRIIACTIEVHKRLGTELLEKLYKEAIKRFVL